MYKGTGVINRVINNLTHGDASPGTPVHGSRNSAPSRQNAAQLSLTHKDWNKPINRVEEAAYKNNVCYLKNRDTETRNEVCDKKMLRELKDIPDKRQDVSRKDRSRHRQTHPGDQTDVRYGVCPIYCPKCKRKTNTQNPERAVARNDRPMLKGVCEECGTRKSTYLRVKTRRV